MTDFLHENEDDRELLARLAALPREITPRRDLLAGIHTAIDDAQVTRLESWRSRSLWSLRWPLATAAMLLILATAVVTRTLLVPATQPVAQAPTSGTGRLVSAELNALEDDYVNAITELQTLIEAQREHLSPRTIELLRQNLAAIDAAIRESRAALQQDPANELVNQMLWSAYEKKVELLRRATTVTST